MIRFYKFVIPALVFLTLASFNTAYMMPTDFKWVLVACMSAIIMLTGAWHILRTRELTLDSIDLSLTLFTGYAALSLMWTPDPHNGFVFILCWLSMWSVLTIIKNKYKEDDAYASIYLATSSAALLVMMLHYIVPGKWSGFYNENFVTEFLLLTLPFIVGAIFSYRDSWVIRIVGVGLLIWIAVYLFWQNPSKIEFFVLPIVLGGWGLVRLWNFSRKSSLILVALGVAVFFILVWVKWSGDNGYGSSIVPRLSIYFDVILMWLQHPLQGNGVGSFSYLIPNFQERHYEYFHNLDYVVGQFNLVGAAHNDYLQFLNDFGLFGAIIVALSFDKIYQLLKFTDLNLNTRVGIFGIAIVLSNAVLEFPLLNPATTLLATISLGLICSSLKIPVIVHIKGSLTALMTSLCLFVIAVFLIFAAFRLDGAQREYLKMANHYGDNPMLAFEHNAEANRLNPFDFHIRVQLFQSLIHWNRTSGNPPFAPKEYDSIYAISSTTGPQPLLLINRLQYLLDTNHYKENRLEVETSLITLKKNFPRNLDVWILDAYYDVLSGQKTEAKKSIATAENLQPDFTHQQQIIALNAMLAN